MRTGPAGKFAVSTAALLLVAGLASVASADEDTPSQQEVSQARAAAQGKARDVATVQAELAVANARLQQSAVAAAQAAEAYNGARWKLQQARAAADEAERAAQRAGVRVRKQQESFSDAVVSSYQEAPELTALAAIVQEDGIAGVLDRTATLDHAQEALDQQYDDFRAASTLAEVASANAERARAEAADLEQQLSESYEAARTAEAGAAAEAQNVAAEKTRLISELAQLQDISVSLAQRRQSALEQQAAEAAALAAQQEQAAAEAAAEPATPATPAEPAQPTPAEPAEPATPAQPAAPPEPEAPESPAPTPEPPAPAPAPAPAPQPPAPPAPASGVSAAIAFAKAQLGEPYVWGADGPDAWDCSGLTMKAWAAGGKYLPHYSVAQYEQSTRISPSQLRPGDLVFWGSSSSSSSIYHVAMYIGNGQMIHAPRTGRPVVIESMYYWIPPNFYARP